MGRAVFTPSRPDRVHDPAVKRVQVLRTILGLVAISWMLLSYGSASDADAVVDDRFAQIRTTLIVLAVTYGTVPFGVRVAFVLGAPLSVTGVAMWELRWLRTRRGISVRGALLR
ncbi:hypothetical protein QNO09_33610 [Streptomyces sp. 378]|uniref:hypothetical protein n=1 Tax=Streptomyces sp. 378 TaxID=3049412 RepID=UPI0024C28FBA|nr:hypothetical protein [Streptomyces sp. 378]MDK1348131.1 hypothetical protein [Streptomyces sp. 378]